MEKKKQPPNFFGVNPAFQIPRITVSKGISKYKFGARTASKTAKMIEKRRSGVEKFDRLCSSRSTFLVVKWPFDHQWFWIYTVGVHKVHHKPYFSFFKIIITVLISVKWSKTFQKNQNFENFHVFLQISEKSYCCRWGYFFTDFLQKSFTTYRSNFNP